MSVPHNGERDDPAPQRPSERCPVGTVEHCLCGLTGLSLTAVLLVAFYPALVALTRPLYVLSSTLLVGIAAALWLLVWFGAEFLWAWRAGRLTTEG